MENPERGLLVESYGKAYQTLVDGLDQFPREMWNFRASPNDWSIHEIIVHITDSEANSYIRARRFIAEPGQAVMAYDENAWLEKLAYDDQSTDDALELFRLLRGNTYKLIQRLSDDMWSNTVHHPENGTMTMDDWLHIYERHIPEHLEQMQAVYEAWQSRNG